MSTVKFDKWQNTDGTENYKCRAWVNFNGTGTVAIRASGNVSSITDNGVGIYTVNLITAMPDTNYSVVGMATEDIDNWGYNVNRFGSLTTSNIGLKTSNSSANVADVSYTEIAIFR